MYTRQILLKFEAEKYIPQNWRIVRPGWRDRPSSNLLTGYRNILEQSQDHSESRIVTARKSVR